MVKSSTHRKMPSNSSTKFSYVLSQKRLKNLIKYEPNTGKFFHLRMKGAKRKEAGCIKGGKYLVIMIDRVLYRASRLAFLYMVGRWPKNEVDHRDGNSLNDRWENLREATRSQNARNTKRPITNKLGLKGVTRRKDRKKCYQAHITINGRFIGLGYFYTKEEAFKRYKLEAIKVGGEFARWE